MDWQEVWQDLEDAYDKVREKKGDGTRPEDVVLDSILDIIDCAQIVCEECGAVPVEPDEDYERCHCQD